MSDAVLLGEFKSIQIEKLESEGDFIVLFATATSTKAPCPKCGAESSRVHSRYSRTLADLPCQAKPVRIRLGVRRFFCQANGCPTRTFVERVPELTVAYARETSRLREMQRQIGHALGGESGSRLARSLGMSTSSDTLLRRVKSLCVQSSKIRVLGVDDWAWKKGQRYGTILCDLERHRVVDLLSERSTTSFAEWLKAHPEVEVISRDRGEEYTKGAALGAPQAVQVADRWHLLHNLRDALTRVVDRHQSDVTAAAKTVSSRKKAETPTGSASEKAQQSLSEQRRENRTKRFDEVISLHRQGKSLRAIASRLGMHRSTVRRWIKADAFPERAKRSYKTRINDHAEYLKCRWREGCRNAIKLTKEMLDIGIKVSYYMVRRQLAKWRVTDATKVASREVDPRYNRPSSRKISWWLLKARSELNDEESRFLEALWTCCPELRNTTELAREFAAIVRERRVDSWDNWVAKAKTIGVSQEIRGFANGLLRDEAAVKNALSLEWSNGQTEGQVNRLKLLKRQMYGRAGFELLRSRLLHAA